MIQTPDFQLLLFPSSQYVSCIHYSLQITNLTFWLYLKKKQNIQGSFDISEYTGCKNNFFIYYIIILSYQFRLHQIQVISNLK